MATPFAPHIAEELWQRLGHSDTLAYQRWPQLDPRYLEQDQFELVVQVMGKVRGRALAPQGAPERELEAIARATAAEHLAGRQVVKTIVVPGRLVNFVLR